MSTNSVFYSSIVDLTHPSYHHGLEISVVLGMLMAVWSADSWKDLVAAGWA